MGKMMIFLCPLTCFALGVTWTSLNISGEEITNLLIRPLLVAQENSVLSYAGVYDSNDRSPYTYKLDLNALNMVKLNTTNNPITPSWFRIRATGAIVDGRLIAFGGYQNDIDMEAWGLNLTSLAWESLNAAGDAPLLCVGCADLRLSRREMICASEMSIVSLRCGAAAPGSRRPRARRTRAAAPETRVAAGATRD